MKILKGFLRAGGKRSLDDELIEIAGSEVMYAAFGANLHVRDNAEIRSVMVQFVDGAMVKGDAESLKGYLARAFPDASEKDISRARNVLLNRIIDRLQRMDYGRSGDCGSRRNFAKDWDSSASTGRSPLNFY